MLPTSTGACVIWPVEAFHGFAPGFSSVVAACELKWRMAVAICEPMCLAKAQPNLITHRCNLVAVITPFNLGSHKFSACCGPCSSVHGMHRMPVLPDCVSCASEAFCEHLRMVDVGGRHLTFCPPWQCKGYLTKSARS